MLAFSQLVRHEGNEALFRAIEMSVLSTAKGIPFHIHVEGLRGTGKTTIMRAVRAVLPRITRIAGCPYNCMPSAPHCPHHSGMDPDQISSLGTEQVAMPFLEISHSAKIGTVVGSIDLARLTDKKQPQAAILPGTIPLANRGIVFVDEINRLAEVAPELADVLLSVMGTKPGRIQIEETGLPVVEMPVTVSVWAASNPDEDPGPLEDVRKQLSDRFDLTINMSRPTSVAQVISILRKTSTQQATAGHQDFTSLIESALTRNATIPPDIEEIVARLYLDFGLESLRAIESLLHAAMMRALLQNRDQVALADVQDVIALALRHRVDMAVLNQILAHIQGLSAKKEVAGHAPDNRTHGSPDADSGRSDEKRVPRDAHDGRALTDPLSRLFHRLRDALVTQSVGSSSTSGSMPAESSGAPGLGSSPNSLNHATPGGYGSSTTSSIGDPMKASLTAPRTRAVPVSLLSTADLIRSPEDLVQ